MQYEINLIKPVNKTLYYGHTLYIFARIRTFFASQLISLILRSIRVSASIQAKIITADMILAISTKLSRIIGASYLFAEAENNFQFAQVVKKMFLRFENA